MNYAKPKYLEKKDVEDIYEMREHDETRIFQEEIEPEERKERVIKKVQRRSLPRMEDKKVEPLNRKPVEIMGTLSDKVKFLKERISEMESMINDRQELHAQMLNDIQGDIEATERMAGQAMDMDERRNLKLDASILRKEKRNENVQYWRDILELRTELRELMEQFQTESEIEQLFKDLKKDTVG